MMSKLLTFILWLGVVHHAHAEEVFVKNLKEKTVAISESEVSLIAVDHDRIQQVRGVSNEYWLQKDEATGTVLVKPLVKTPIQIFITTESKQHYPLRMLPKHKDAKPIVLKVEPQKLSMRDQTNTKTLADTKSQFRIDTQDIDKLIASKIVKPSLASKAQPLTPALKRYRCGMVILQGHRFHRYRLTNISSKQLFIEDKLLLEFSKSKPVLFKKTTLSPNQSLFYYEVTI